MKNYILQIILKPKDKRTIGENATMIRFWNECTPQEFKYAYQLNQLFK